MRILDENNHELQAEEVDLSVGYLALEKLLEEHHEATPEVQEEGHYYPERFYFMDDSVYEVASGNEDDPCVKANEDGVSFSYIAPEGEEEREFKGCDVRYIIDVEHQDAKEAWDEYEDIQRYKLYTPEQLKEKQEREQAEAKREAFLSTGPERLDSVETDVDDMTLLIADMIGV